MPSKISWTDETWNPIVGCSKCSPGCDHCWAEIMARLHYHSEFPKGWDGHVRLFPNRLAQPLCWRKPRMIAVGLMGDLFHASVPDEFIVDVFKTAALAHWHTFQILTKRHDRMLRIIPQISGSVIGEFERMQAIGGIASRVVFRALDIKRRDGILWQWPLPNVWLGFTAEDQKRFEERWQYVRQCPAAVYFVSIEPCLGRIILPEDFLSLGKRALCIIGNESGPGARPGHPDWVRSLRDQCVAAGVPFHFKQWGAWMPIDWEHHSPHNGDLWIWRNGDTFGIEGHGLPSSVYGGAALMRRVGKANAGHLLDGKEWLEFPEKRL